MKGYNVPTDNSFDQSLFSIGHERKKIESAKEYTIEPNVSLEYLKEFMERWHYSRSANVAAVYNFALTHQDWGIVGGIIFAKPAMSNIYKLYAESMDEVIEIRRMVLIDDTPKNTESWFLGKALRWLVLNTDKKVVVTYADPKKGHVGIAYRACNFIYDGMSGQTQVLLLPLSECAHDGQCARDGKEHCQVHGRNMRWKNRCPTHPTGYDREGNKCKCKMDYTDTSKRYRALRESGEATAVNEEAKMRYHYHLDRLRNKFVIAYCRQCEENRKKVKAVAL